MRIGIAATIGGLKPVALVGLLRALDNYGHLKDVVAYSGASGGSIWCSLAAAGYTPAQLWDIALSIQSKSMWEDWDYSHITTAIWHSILQRKPLPGFTGIMKGGLVLHWLQEKLGTKTFEELMTPCYITAFDINHGRSCIFGPGITPTPVEVAKAVRGSTAIPFGFQHQTIRIAPGPEGECGFWDGGVTSTMPLAPLTDFHDLDMIIALDATGATNPPGCKWESISELGSPDLFDRMISGLVDESNSSLLKLSKHVCRTEIMQISVSASMSRPKETIEPALVASYKDASVFLAKIFSVN